jgi:translation initiation factor IF-2
MTFAVKDDGKATLQAERFGFTLYSFDIIYKLAEWFDTIVEERLPFEEIEEVLGKLTILKTFSTQKDNHVIGGKVTQGTIKLGSLVKIERRGFELGKGKISELQMQKIKAKEVQEGNECGLMIESKTEMIPGDIIIAIAVVKKRLS